jgi:uncharacterized protein YqfA (UPF0365 family)
MMMEDILLAKIATIHLVLAIIAGIIGLVFVLIFMNFIKIWIQALFSGAKVSIFDLIGMALRGVPRDEIVRARIAAVQAGIADLDTKQLESVWLVGKNRFPRKGRIDRDTEGSKSSEQWQIEKAEQEKRFWMSYQNQGDVMTCVNSLIIARKADLPVTFAQLQAHHFSGGYVMDVVHSMVAAQRAKIPLSFDVARAIDLAGRDILRAVETTVTPKIIDCPLDRSMMLDAVAKDGIRLLVRARVTVRSNINQLVRGATDETIIARVGQGIVSAIGSAETYKHVLENPDRISRKVLESGLDAQTAYEIVSIDIADVSVAGVSTKDTEVANVGAKLETERAEADKRMRQAEAEGRRAMAVAREQEMTALVQENRAKVVLAEAEIPLAMADSFRKGNLGIMDYYRMKNIVADTSMRDSIAKPKTKKDS